MPDNESRVADKQRIGLTLSHPFGPKVAIIVSIACVDYCFALVPLPSASLTISISAREPRCWGSCLESYHILASPVLENIQTYPQQQWKVNEGQGYVQVQVSCVGSSEFFSTIEKSFYILSVKITTTKKP